MGEKEPSIGQSWVQTSVKKLRGSFKAEPSSPVAPLQRSNSRFIRKPWSTVVEQVALLLRPKHEYARLSYASVQQLFPGVLWILFSLFFGEHNLISILFRVFSPHFHIFTFSHLFTCSPLSNEKRSDCIFLVLLVLDLCLHYTFFLTLQFFFF